MATFTPGTPLTNARNLYRAWRSNQDYRVLYADMVAAYGPEETEDLFRAALTIYLADDEATNIADRQIETFL